jgi:hypothetical protein
MFVRFTDPKCPLLPIVGTIVEKRSVSIARVWIGMGCMTDMERRNAVAVYR